MERPEDNIPDADILLTDRHEPRFMVERIRSKQRTKLRDFSPLRENP
jgi:hypothetical protein